VPQDSSRHWKLVSRPVRIVPSSEFASRRDALPSEWRKHWKRFLELTKATGGGQKAVHAFGQRAVAPEYLEMLTRNPRAWLAGHFNRAIGFVRFGLWQDKEGRGRPGLICISEYSVPFALAAYNIGSAKGMRVCQRERCGKLFSSTRPQQMFCSPQCRHADQQQRYRLRHASK
jgi:hypothetical protein